MSAKSPFVRPGWCETIDAFQLIDWAMVCGLPSAVASSIPLNPFGPVVNMKDCSCSTPSISQSAASVSCSRRRWSVLLRRRPISAAPRRTGRSTVTRSLCRVMSPRRWGRACVGRPRSAPTTLCSWVSYLYQKRRGSPSSALADHCRERSRIAGCPPNRGTPSRSASPVCTVPRALPSSKRCSWRSQGYYAAMVDLDAGTAKVIFDPSEIDAGRLCALVTEQGYPASVAASTAS